MKIQRIIILAVVFVVLSQCKKNTEEPYSNVDIVMDNAQATLYFHTVFCEAEYAWAFADINKYEDKTIADPKRKLTYLHNSKEKANDSVAIEYNDYVLKNYLSLTGKIIVTFDNDSSYRKISKKASILLDDFSINGQSVIGEATITYRKTATIPNDQYTYTLLNGANIREAGTSAILISCVIANGQYERIKENNNPDGDDDDDNIWVYTGDMTGTLLNDPNLKYTNTVPASSYTLNGETKDGKIRFTKDCSIASEGLSLIKIAKRPDILYFYNCEELYFESTEHHIR